MSKQLEAGFLFHRQPINELEAEDCFTGRDICWFDRVKIVIVTISCTGNSGNHISNGHYANTVYKLGFPKKHSRAALMHSEDGLVSCKIFLV